MSKTISGIEQIKPNSLDYKTIKTALQSNNSRRYTNRLTPSTNTTVFRPGQKIEWNLPTSGFLDVKNTSLMFTGKSTGGGINTCFNNFIECIINKLEWNLGDSSSKVEFIQQYNLHASSLCKFGISQDYGNTIASVQQGLTDSLNTRLAWAQDGHRYAVNLIGSGVMNNNLKYLPLGLLAKIGGFSRALQLVITLESAEQCMINTDGGNDARSYEISEPIFQMDIIECPEYEAELMRQIMSGSMVLGIPINTSRNWSRQIPANLSNNVDFNFLEYKQFLTGVRTIFKNGVPNSTKEEFTWDFMKPDIKEYYWVVKNMTYPNERVRMSSVTGFSESINELLKYFNKMRTYDKSILYGLQTRNPENPSDVAIFRSTNPILSTNITPFNVDFTNIKGDWDNTTSDELIPNDIGSYKVSIVLDSVQSNTDIINSNASFIIEFIDAANIIISSLLVPVNILAPSGQIGLTHTLSFIADLDFNVYYSVRITQLNSNIDLTILNIEFTAFLIDNIQSELQTLDSNFLIANTFKTWFDNEDNLTMNGEFLLDGLNTINNNQLTLFLELASGNSQSLGLNVFTDFIRVLTIDNKTVQIIE